MSIEQTAALGQMRAARRRHFVEQLDLMEVLYRVYLGVIFGGIALAVIAGWVEEAPATAAAVADMRDHGPAVLGLVLALAVLLGLRSGARGGPLAIEAAEVQYVLLAPIDRGTALRPAALRQLRVAVLGGAVLGAVIGNFVFRRLPGSPVEWIACLALFGALLPLCALAAALLGSGRRLRPVVATALGFALIAWSLADLLLGATTSPATMAGEIGTLPLQGGGRPLVLAALGLAILLALAWTGIRSVGRIALEAARRRAALTAELRFSASVQDLRTVVLLRRQLAAERPRRRPWVRVRTGASPRHAIWRRGWQSFLRWPLGRVVRVLAIAIAAGAAMAAAWSGVTLLFALPGALLLVAALDLVEPLAQESDHPTRRELLPLAADSLIRRHLIPACAAMAAVLALAALSALALRPGREYCRRRPGDAVPDRPAAGLLRRRQRHQRSLCLRPQSPLGYAQTAAPIVIAVVATGGPALVAREAARRGGSAPGAAISVELVLLLIGLAMAWWLGKRMADQAAVAP